MLRAIRRALAARILAVRAVEGRLQNTAYYGYKYTNFSGVTMRILANQVNPFYIENHPT
jgi:hypothetical protein